MKKEEIITELRLCDFDFVQSRDYLANQRFVRDSLNSVLAMVCGTALFGMVIVSFSYAMATGHFLPYIWPRIILQIVLFIGMLVFAKRAGSFSWRKNFWLNRKTYKEAKTFSSEVRRLIHNLSYYETSEELEERYLILLEQVLPQLQGLRSRINRDLKLLATGKVVRKADLEKAKLFLGSLDSKAEDLLDIEGEEFEISELELLARERIFK